MNSSVSFTFLGLLSRLGILIFLQPIFFLNSFHSFSCVWQCSRKCSTVSIPCPLSFSNSRLYLFLWRFVYLWSYFVLISAYVFLLLHLSLSFPCILILLLCPLCHC